MKAKTLMPLRFNYFCDIQKLTFILILVLVTSCQPNSNKNNSKEDVVELETPTDSMITTTEILIDSLPLKQVDSLPKEVVEKIETPATKPVPVKKSSIYFENPIHQFSRMTEGDTLNHTFVFENRGNAPLTIQDVSVDCGCTVPEYSTDAIAPVKKAP
ncbi:MAG: DUF1573 domain-containing protein [Chitinophagales bacterium]